VGAAISRGSLASLCVSVFTIFLHESTINQGIARGHRVPMAMPVAKMRRSRPLLLLSAQHIPDEAA